MEGLLDVEGLELVNVFTVLCELALADTDRSTLPKEGGSDHRARCVSRMQQGQDAESHARAPVPPRTLRRAARVSPEHPPRTSVLLVVLLLLVLN